MPPTSHKVRQASLSLHAILFKNVTSFPLHSYLMLLKKSYVFSVSVIVNCSGWVTMVDEWMNATAAIANGTSGFMFSSLICFPFYSSILTKI